MKNKCNDCYYVIIILCLIFIIGTDFIFHNLYSNLINFGILIVSIFAFVLAYKTKNDWLRSIYKDKELNAKNDFMISIIDMMATLDMNSWDNLPMSEETENNPEISTKITIDSTIMHQELLKIDIEFTKKMRLVNKNYEIYHYYCGDNIKMETIKKFLDALRSYRNKIYWFVWLKLRFYLKEESSDFEKFEAKRPEIEKLRNEMNAKFSEFKNKLK